MQVALPTGGFPITWVRPLGTFHKETVVISCPLLVEGACISLRTPCKPRSSFLYHWESLMKPQVQSGEISWYSRSGRHWYFFHLHFLVTCVFETSWSLIYNLALPFNNEVLLDMIIYITCFIRQHVHNKQLNFQSLLKPSSKLKPVS